MRLIEFSLRRRSPCRCARWRWCSSAWSRSAGCPSTCCPDLSYPSLTVETRFPGAAPAEVESLVTPAGRGGGGHPGRRAAASPRVSRPGLSQVTLEFDWGREHGLRRARRPAEARPGPPAREAEKPVILRFDPANDPILRLYLTGGHGPLPPALRGRGGAQEGPGVDRRRGRDQGQRRLGGGDPGPARRGQALAARPLIADVQAGSRART